MLSLSLVERSPIILDVGKIKGSREFLDLDTTSPLIILSIFCCFRHAFCDRQDLSLRGCHRRLHLIQWCHRLLGRDVSEGNVGKGYWHRYRGSDWHCFYRNTCPVSCAGVGWSHSRRCLLVVGQAKIQQPGHGGCQGLPRPVGSIGGWKHRRGQGERSYDVGT